MAVLGETVGRQLFGNFADMLEGEARVIAAEAGAGDLQQTGRHAHSLKGAAANFGAARLQMTLADIEQAAASVRAPRRLERLLARLQRDAHSTSVAARRF